MVASLLKLAEIQTKLASQLPLLLGTLYTLYAFDEFNIINFLCMFLSLLSFDMATTVVNNYMDWKKAIKKSGYGYEVHNAIVRDNLSERTVLLFLTTLLTIAVVFGILLYLNTSIVVLLLGIFSFGIGIVYSYGPVPISRTPFGEIFSGGVMGFVIPFLAIYIHIYHTDPIIIDYSSGQLSLIIDIKFLLSVFFLSIPPMFTIANIMLANNTCDMEDDIVNKRYTLPIHIGLDKSLKLFKALYYAIYIAIVFGCIIDVLPIGSLFTLLTFPLVKDNVHEFYKEQKKATTFVVAIKNLVLINLSFAITIFVSILFK